MFPQEMKKIIKQMKTKPADWIRVCIKIKHIFNSFNHFFFEDSIFLSFNGLAILSLKVSAGVDLVLHVGH